MNKNIIIGVLIIIVAVLGFFVVNGNGVLQQASIIKSGIEDGSVSRAQFEQSIKKVNGTVYQLSDEQLDAYRRSTRDLISVFEPVPDLYIYGCFVSGLPDPIFTTTVLYYGNTWYPSGTNAVCYYFGQTAN